MQFTAARRPGKTYGKVNRNVLVHNLFDYGAHRNDASEIPLPNASTAPLSEAPIHTTPTETAQTKKSSRSNTGKLSSTNSTVVDSRDDPSPERQALANVDLFDLNSSEEDPTTDTSGSRASKRRRIVKPLHGFRTHGSETDKPKSQAIQKLPLRPEENGKKVASMKKQPDLKKPSKRLPPSRLTQAPSQNRDPDSKLPDLRNKPTKSEPQTSRLGSSGPTVTTLDDANVQMADRPVAGTSEDLSDSPRQSSDRRGTTSKRLKLSPCDKVPRHSSPSQLGLTSLKIGTSASGPARLSSESTSDNDATPYMPRRRLIDRLDAPAKTLASASDGSKSDQSRPKSPSKLQNTNKDRQKLSRSQGKASVQAESQSKSAADRSQGSQSRATWATKPRTTYASQRSHLSDMVDDLDVLSVPSSQKSRKEIALKVTASNLGSQLDLEQEDSEDQMGASKLKSIHELRQAGANKRFDREIDTLLEDIDAGESVSKALRLQALIKLIGRLQDAVFLRQFVAGARIQRLGALANSTLDLTTSTLLLCVFVLLINSEDATPDVLDQIFRTSIKLAPSLLANKHSLSRLARDRKENHSRLMVQDLIEFEQTLVTQLEMLQDEGHVYLDLLTLRCLEGSLRKIMKLGEVPSKTTTATYNGLLELLSLHTQDVTQKPQNVLSLTKMEIALSFLELCSVVIDDADFHVEDSQFQVLGNALAGIMHQKNRKGELFEQSVLRVVVSISNNKPRMCNLLGHTSITDGAFRIINQHFLGLSEQADQKQILDASKLDSVLLALGCLLNFAECDASLRAEFVQSRAHGGSPVSQLVTIFNAQVSKMDDAVTQEQSQVLVAFGYLSMLLCTLSLDPQVRRKVTQQLKEKSFRDVCVAAETFFRHLRTVEAMSGSETSVDNFTARFSVILETIRESDD